MAKTGFARPVQQGAEEEEPPGFCRFSGRTEGCRPFFKYKGAVMRRRWTKTDKTLFLVYAGVIMCFARLNSTYQSCVDFQPFLVLAFVLVFAGGILIKNMGGRKSVFAGIAAAVLLECAAVYAILPADTYAEGGLRMQERWLEGYGAVELMGETGNFIGFFTGYDTENAAQRFFNRITGRSEKPVFCRRPYVYVFGAGNDIAACIYDPFSGESRIAVLEGMRFLDWKQELVSGNLEWTKGQN